MADIARRRADWSALRVFFAVAEAGGINAAARALNLSPSTVTRTIEDLEHQLNVTLFARSPRGMSLTEAGEMAYQRVLTMERTAATLEMEIGDLEALPEGKVKLAVPDGVAGYFITPFLPELLRAHPGLDLSVDCGLWPDRPLDGEAELTVSYSEPTVGDLVARPIAYMHYACFASREYINLYGELNGPEELLKHPYVHHVAHTHQREVWTEEQKALQVLTNKRIQTNSSAVVVQAVKNGIGVAFLPTAILSVEPDLVMVEGIPPVAPMKLWMVHHREATRSARIRAVADWLKSIFDGRTRPWYRAEFVHPRDFSLPAVAAAKALAPA
ncbi:MAG TPA: LysR family transcriptional regulator [Phenylobacterium sp.]|uniref:LysR family transcriptional regulator n=1 Tax=Phenylobacterium sp. TaxID=1871053 RepID=UPI002CBBC0A8|nr:LysR family transcriptional regulator [Phenylobacterium sp.]HSV04255.1 LysR family transcriptional regulator [Phenylobacterium sp.]